MDVGTKDLKNRLSHYLRQVRAGEIIRVTDRGTVVAEIRPVSASQEHDSEHLHALAARGLVSVGSEPTGDFAPVRIRARCRASDIVIADRG